MKFPRMNISHGAFQLWRSHSHFPKGTTHLVVVDPGVGTSRRGVLVKTKKFSNSSGQTTAFFAGPLTRVREEEKKKAQVFENTATERSLAHLSWSGFFCSLWGFPVSIDHKGSKKIPTMKVGKRSFCGGISKTCALFLFSSLTRVNGPAKNAVVWPDELKIFRFNQNATP